MGIEPFLITASVNMVVAQRLARRICDHCKEPITYPEETLKLFGIADGSARVYQGIGCDICRGSGYKGRVALYEVLIVTDTMRDRIVQGLSTTELKRLAIQEGMLSLRTAGIGKILAGVTTIEEVLATTAADIK
jgi:type IV pilus assembly protein PilB